ncbi:unnamed protein product [Mucor fragilis]
MANISSLPEELLRRVFGYINSSIQLAQCRLVCKKWNPHADTSMFSNTIVLRCREKALLLHALLFAVPAKGKLIRNIYFDEKFDTLWVIKAIFNAISIPNLESLMGTALTPEFCDLLLEITARSPGTFKKLKSLPKYQQDVDQKYLDVLLAFKETLEEIDIDNESKHLNDALMKLVPHPNSFSNLNSLKFAAKFHQLSDVESILNGCMNLKTLELGNLWEGRPMDKTALDAWMVQNVTQVESLEQLVIKHQCRCDVIEYLVYKYPNIQSLNISLNHPGYMYATNMPQFKTNMDRIFRAIEDIPYKKFSFWLPSNANFLQIVDYFTNKDFSFIINKKDSKNFLLVEVGGL